MTPFADEGGKGRMGDLWENILNYPKLHQPGRSVYAPDASEHIFTEPLIARNPQTYRIHRSYCGQSWRVYVQLSARLGNHFCTLRPCHLRTMGRVHREHASI